MGDLCMAIKHEREGNTSAAPGNWILYAPSVELPSGIQCMFQVEQGSYLGNMKVGSGPDYRGPMYLNPLAMFPQDRDLSEPALRPWLFGNWWRSNEVENPLQLIGVGVRLSRAANIEAAEGNTSDLVKLRGSLIRVRSDDGE